MQQLSRTTILRLLPPAFIILVLACWYQGAPVDMLRFLTEPASWLLELLSVQPSLWLEGQGHLALSGLYIITKDCAAFPYFLLCLAWIAWRIAPLPVKTSRYVRSLIVAPCLAWGITVAVNSLRIATSLLFLDGQAFHSLVPKAGGLIHEAIGLGSFAMGLVVLNITIERYLHAASPVRHPEKPADPPRLAAPDRCRPPAA